MKKFNHSDFKETVGKLDIKIFISSSSFEERCFITPKLLNENANIKCLYYFNSNEDELIITNAEKLTGINNNSLKFPLSSDDPIGIYNTIEDSLSASLSVFDKPNILIDITTFTHEALLILLKVLELNQHLLGEINYSYIGAEDYSYNSSNDNEKWLSKGIKTIRTVLGYSGFTDPTYKNHLMILFGFESERTKKIIEEYEFDCISLGFANLDESIQNNHYRINQERHKDLLKEFPNAKAFHFSLIDAYQTKNDILNYLNENDFDSHNTVIAPLNTKISTIGAGLAAIQNGNIQLAYAKPNIYNVSGYSKANEFIYLDTINF